MRKNKQFSVARDSRDAAEESRADEAACSQSCNVNKRRKSSEGEMRKGNQYTLEEEREPG